MRLTFIIISLLTFTLPAWADDDPMAFARAGMSSTPTNASGTFGDSAPLLLSGGDLLASARKYLGARRSPTGFRGPWCGDGLAFFARKVGADVPKNYRLARSWAGAGTHSAPRVGAVAVMRHHVTIIAQLVPGGFIGLGANQGHRVKYSRYSWRGVIAIRSV